MNRFLIPTFVGMVLFTTTQPTLAQNFQNLPLRNPRQPPEGYISVQSGISISYPVTDGDNEEQQEKALKSFYKIAASSCTTLLETIADACEISAMSSNSSVNNPDNRGTRLSVSGQVTMSVKLKPAAAVAK
ncbi:MULTISPECIES: hypothetical protein [unclassified Rhizobium]|jgi:hypothetical protein|uniref:hypothetical protein n=1 Tax=unclassified Rhizobium TaxID=2613769 RepID=UPI000DE1348C|nr:MULTISPECIES: hypothetical protein [unclassified Rhizobium]MBB3288353.1 hypothetical protein [Rhizobium sp. BK252]MBB3402784.1 hypothetical protein [Rhizobium sp. BK289]MBB3415361.1 hypothetical protein [Rhizobium sp. BK284]MBB3483559.1 hypothetical protein [Rhizobium sp. BK347]MDK4723755.1 hypothetical protein [Rhizobium sp. CNPSo 3968]